MSDILMPTGESANAPLLGGRRMTGNQPCDDSNGRVAHAGTNGAASAQPAAPSVLTHLPLREAFRNVPLLVMFYEIGKEFQEGAQSLRNISKIFEARDLSGDNPNDIPCSTATVSRASGKAERCFRAMLNLGDDAPLFIRDGHSPRVSGLTELGVHVWRLTEKFLVENVFPR